jgi:GMP synthase-like glutamine amidotransferase
MKQLEIIQNDPTVPVGVFGTLLREWCLPYRILRADAGQSLPVSDAAIIVLGGVMGVHDEARHPFLRPLKEHIHRALTAGRPLLGVCLGGQLLADVAGGVASSNRCGEKGLVEISLTAAGIDDPLFAGFDRRFQAFQWHNDSFTIPPGAQHLATSAGCPGQSFRVGNAWGVQFHPEVDAAIVAAWARHTPDELMLTSAFAAGETAHRLLARQLLANFLAFATRQAC